jgi:hypothetical protein
MAEYNGYKSWNSWNVSLWLNNDEGNYKATQKIIATTRERASKLYPEKSRGRYQFILTRATNEIMGSFDSERTPDGAVFNRSCVKEFLENELYSLGEYVEGRTA